MAVESPKDLQNLDEARQWVFDNVLQGAVCPCCRQLAKVYDRSLHKGMIEGLVKMWRIHQDNWAHVPSTEGLSKLGGEFARMRFWGLIEEATEKREDGGRAGWWRITEFGRRFILGEVSVPKTIYLYDNEVQGSTQGEQIFVYSPLGKFRYDELMGYR
jgi:hypothetical protein